MDPVSASRAPYNFGNSKHWESESKKARDARQAELDRLDNQLAALGRARQKLDLAETCYMRCRNIAATFDSSKWDGRRQR